MPNDNGRLDELDSKLIELLQHDGRTSNSRLARELGVTEATVRRRIGQLESSGVIRVSAVTDTETRGNEHFFWTWIRVEGREAADVANDVAKIPESITVTLVSGNYDIFASFSARDMPHMERVLISELGTIRGVHRYDTALALDILLSDVRWGRFVS